MAYVIQSESGSQHQRSIADDPSSYSERQRARGESPLLVAANAVEINDVAPTHHRLMQFARNRTYILAP